MLKQVEAKLVAVVELAELVELVIRDDCLQRDLRAHRLLLLEPISLRILLISHVGRDAGTCERRSGLTFVHIIKPDE